MHGLGGRHAGARGQFGARRGRAGERGREVQQHRRHQNQCDPPHHQHHGIGRGRFAEGVDCDNRREPEQRIGADQEHPPERGVRRLQDLGAGDQQYGKRRQYGRTQ
ncbi:hypothetical protein G6F57_023506 [Rhizopus arrhizus]|uniref:Uncharacterized protein n=1 Tax=Rhizopus delemar TaxID=936053 RepID=A0A9P6XNX7_9FUNG|nr:hypothetical protein G6F23_014989 [Rhizopus arrhizus]KAG1423229.1 hypothetical protein G6F57_023506 [Rhizopus arrhizus]KAG1529586.1 hypothetical protein G6F50_017896 [Rhizopus delemar]